MAADQFGDVIKQVHRMARLGARTSETDGQLPECFLRNRDETAFEVLVRRHAEES